MVNFPNDIEYEEDYEMGWCWPEVDTGPAIAPYSDFLSVPTRTYAK